MELLPLIKIEPTQGKSVKFASIILKPDEIKRPTSLAPIDELKGSIKKRVAFQTNEHHSSPAISKGYAGIIRKNTKHHIAISSSSSSSSDEDEESKKSDDEMEEELIEDTDRDYV